MKDFHAKVDENIRLTKEKDECGSGAGCLYKDATIERLTAERDRADLNHSICKGAYAQVVIQNDALKADAARYQVIQAENRRIDPICALVWKKNKDRNSWEWVNSAGAVEMSEALDAIAKESKT